MIELLYTKYHSELLKYCISLSHNHVFAEDIVQESSCVLFQMLISKRANRTLVQSMALRDRKTSSSTMLAFETRNILRNLSAKMTTDTVVELCSHLPKSERVIFQLR